MLQCLVQPQRDSDILILGVKNDAYLYANAGLTEGAKNGTVSILSLAAWGSTPIGRINPNFQRGKWYHQGTLRIWTSDFLIKGAH